MHSLMKVYSCQNKITFFFMNGNTERAQCALSLFCIPQEMGKKGSKKNKKVYKIFKKCNKKNHAICMVKK